MLVALMLHSAGNSTPRCSKLMEPSRQLVMTTSRRSHVTSSYGCTPAVVKTRLIFRPLPRLGALALRRGQGAAKRAMGGGFKWGTFRVCGGGGTRAWGRVRRVANCGGQAVTIR